MRIGIIGSMRFTDKMVEVRDKLNAMGHDAFLTTLHVPMLSKSPEEIEQIKKDLEANADPIREFWKMMQGADAVLVLNFDKDDIKNYVGGNTLMEIGFAHVLDQKIFLWNPIPDTKYCKGEIESVKPTVIYGDLSKIK
jgi:hypothetical protein